MPTADDNTATPGRKEAPIPISRDTIGEWVAQGHLWCTTLIDGDHQGKALWWDGQELYQFADG